MYINYEYNRMLKEFIIFRKNNWIFGYYYSDSFFTKHINSYLPYNILIINILYLVTNNR